MSDITTEKIYGADESDRNTRLLRIRVLCAKDLQRRDLLGGSGDPYVKILLQTRENRNQTTDIACTRSVLKTLNPVWNQDFLFRVLFIKKKERRNKKQLLNSFVSLIRLIQLNIDWCSKFIIKIHW